MITHEDQCTALRSTVAQLRKRVAFLEGELQLQRATTGSWKNEAKAMKRMRDQQRALVVQLAAENDQLRRWLDGTRE